MRGLSTKSLLVGEDETLSNRLIREFVNVFAGRSIFICKKADVFYRHHLSLFYTYTQNKEVYTQICDSNYKYTKLQGPNISTFLFFPIHHLLLQYSIFAGSYVLFIRHLCSLHKSRLKRCL